MAKIANYQKHWVSIQHCDLFKSEVLVRAFVELNFWNNLPSASQPMSYNDLSSEHSGGRAKFCNNSPSGLTLNALNNNSCS